MQNINWDYYYQITEEKLKELDINELEVDRNCKATSTDEVYVYLRPFNENEMQCILDIIIKLDNKDIIINRVKRDDAFWVYIYFKYKIKKRE